MTAAGWYTDPSDPTTQRYFDGTQWTGHTAPLNTPVTVEQTAATQQMDKLNTERKRNSVAFLVLLGVAFVVAASLPFAWSTFGTPAAVIAVIGLGCFLASPIYAFKALAQGRRMARLDPQSTASSSTLSVAVWVLLALTIVTLVIFGGGILVFLRVLSALG